MPRKSNKSMPTVISGTLYTNDSNNGLRVGSEAWLSWLSEARSFYFDDPQGTFTARRETRRNGAFWYAFKTVRGKTRKLYLGKSEWLTNEHLSSVAQQIGL